LLASSFPAAQDKKKAEKETWKDKKETPLVPPRHGKSEAGSSSAECFSPRATTPSESIEKQRLESVKKRTMLAVGLASA
jgi:hypothetical protein